MVCAVFSAKKLVGTLVAENLFRFGIELYGSPKARDDIAQMGQCGREMADFDGGVEIRSISNGIEEVFLMGAMRDVTLFAFDRFVVFTEHLDAGPPELHHALGAIENDTVAVLVFSVG